MKKEVCILIVTYNRKKYLKKLLATIPYQTVKVSGIFIFDNHCSDGTEFMLNECKIIDNIRENEIIAKRYNDINYYYYRNSQNEGGAMGFNKGFDMISNMQKFDYIWVMDDDVLPENDCLEKLLKYQNGDTMITIPNRTDENYKDKVCIKIDKKNPFKIFMHKKSFINKEMLKNEEFINAVDMAFEGPLINCKLINEIGIPDETYFIQYDDTDYATRAINVTKIKFITKAILHKQIIPDKNKKREMNWKDYYAYRNDIIYCRKYGENIFVKYLTPILLYFNLMCKAIIKRKKKNIKVINKAFLDGYTGKNGKTVEPGEF